MKNTREFSIPKADLNRAYLRVLTLLIIGMAYPFYVGRSNLSATIITFTIVVILVGSLYLWTLRYKWIKVSPSGIQGLSAFGTKITISWLEPVKLGRRTAFNGIECIAIQTIKESRALMLPSSIARTPEFMSAIKHVAPPDHPIVKEGLNAL